MCPMVLNRTRCFSYKSIATREELLESYCTSSLTYEFYSFTNGLEGNRASKKRHSHADMMPSFVVR